MKTVLMLTIAFRPNVGGVETHLDDLCSYLTKNGYRVYVVTYQPITTKERGELIERKGNLTVHRIPWFGHGLFHRLEPYPVLEFLYLTPMLLLYSLFFMFRKGKAVEVIHAHGLNAAFVAKALGKIFKKKFIVSIHAVYGLSTAKFFRWILSSATTVLAASKKVKEELLAAGLPEDKLKVFVHWVDQELFKPLDRAKCKRELGLEGKFTVLFVGRLIEKKGVHLLLEAASRMDLDDVVFAFLGNGPLVDEIKERNLAQKNILFVGKVSEGEMVKYYNAAELVVVPSLYDEPFGRVIVEAFSCSVPVIASNRGGIPEILNPEVGMLIEPSVQEIDEKIRYFHRNQDRLLEIAENCRKYAETYYSQKNAVKIEESYR